MITWLRIHWYIPLLLLLGIVALIVMGLTGGHYTGLMDLVARELRVIGAGRDARDLVIQKGYEAATADIQKKYAESRTVLAATQKDEAAKLEDDPVALAQYLERVTRQS